MKSHSMRKRVGATIGAAALLLLMTACNTANGGSPNGGSSASSGKSLAGKTIAIIQSGAAEYYLKSTAGSQAAITQLGGQSKVFDSAFDTTKELANVNAAIASKVDGIILFPLTDASAKAELRLANNAKIPVSVLYGYSTENEPNAVGFVQVNFVNQAKALGAAFAKLVPSGPIAIVSGTVGRSEVTAFHDGFVAGFGDASRIVEELPGNYDRKVAFSATQDIITKHPDLAGLVVGNEDMAAGAVSALGSKLSQVKVASQNGSPEGNALLTNGSLAVTVGASPTQEAAMSVRYLADALAGTPITKKLCNTPWAINMPGSIKSVSWDTSADVIGGGLADPPPCSSQ